MLESTVTEEHFQETVAALTFEDAEIGRTASDAWTSLTAGDGPSMSSLADLSNWPWWLLPKRWHAHDEQHFGYWVASADAAAQLFDRLGDAAYAEVCRSETTRTVLTAWSHSRSKGLAATPQGLESKPGITARFR